MKATVERERMCRQWAFERYYENRPWDESLSLQGEEVRRRVRFYYDRFKHFDTKVRPLLIEEACEHQAPQA